MYLPTDFRVEQAALLQLIRDHALGTLIYQRAEGFDAEHLPFLLEERAGEHYLQAHIARANPLSQCHQPLAVMVVFRAEQGYISPSWYPGKAEHHQAVPTWNYAVAHAHGQLSLRDDERFLQRVLARLTAQHEKQMERPWRIGDAPRDYLQQMITAIIGVEIKLERLEGKFKLSQNKNAADRQGVVNGLEAHQMGALAARMKQQMR
ncbi:FMN-binding negative transcriptional regulator [Serratia microhaemolytica]|uniref:FMN-binding negative transcriptional regulator n=1 Tax=Serratia microhaemolytica TaxID=2675110 RepID=UPI000FDE1E34|nr:FMN-binding negative transcriptional regulator [Serratia microhaemolytica]